MILQCTTNRNSRFSKAMQYTGRGVKYITYSSALKFLSKYPDMFIWDMGFVKIICWAIIFITITYKTRKMNVMFILQTNTQAKLDDDSSEKWLKFQNLKEITINGWLTLCVTLSVLLSQPLRNFYVSATTKNVRRSKFELRLDILFPKKKLVSNSTIINL